MSGESAKPSSYHFNQIAVEASFGQLGGVNVVVETYQGRLASDAEDEPSEGSYMIFCYFLLLMNNTLPALSSQLGIATQLG